MDKNQLLIVESLSNETHVKNIKPFNTNLYVQNVYDVSDPYNVNVDDGKKLSLVGDDIKKSSLVGFRERDNLIHHYCFE